MKTRMLFVIQNLKRSEESVALLERLYRLPPGEYDVDLLVLSRRRGDPEKRFVHPLSGQEEMYRKLPAHINILSDNIINDKRYDTAASFSDGEAAAYVADRICARRKYLFLFGETTHISKYDYINKLQLLPNRTDKQRGGKLPKQQLYGSFDQIYAANFVVKAAFLRKYPALAGRTFILPETLHWDRVERLAGRQGGFADKAFDGIRILSVDSLGFRGHFDLALAAAKQLKERGFYFRWYLIGDGFGQWRMKLLIRTMGLAEHMVLLGKKANPYPYIRQCDLYAAIGDASRSAARNIPSGLDWNTGADFAGIEGALLLEKYVIATDDVQMHCRLLEWEEDAVLVPPEPSVFADAVEYMAGEL